MNRFIVRTCIAGYVLCVISLCISIYPSALQQLFCLLIGLSLIVVPYWFVRLVVLHNKAKISQDELGWVFPKRWMVMTVMIVAATYLSVKFYLPRRVVFTVHRYTFAAHVDTAPESDYLGDPLGRWLGVYYVDEYAKDPRGGVYFRTATTPDMININSWGFAYQPNDEGSPFGNAYYRIHPLGDGWYWFVANDDW